MRQRTISVRFSVPFSVRFSVPFLALSLGGMALGCGLNGLQFDLPSSGGGSASVGSDGAGAGRAACNQASPTGAVDNREITCTNGQDDDGDGTVDCSDPDCTMAGYRCIDVPSDWQGPVVLLEGDAAANPCCPSDFPRLVRAGGAEASPTGNPACAPCGCSPAPPQCDEALIQIFSDAACAIPAGTLPAVSACQKVQGLSFRAQAPTATPLGCTRSGGELTGKRGVSWSNPAAICGTVLNSGGPEGCPDNKVCAKTDAPAGANGTCFWLVGMVDCPPQRPRQHVFYTGVQDGQRCGECSCGPPTEAHCSATTALYRDSNKNSCDAEKRTATFPDDGGCHPLSNATTSLATTLTPNAPTCAASGGELILGPVTHDPGSAITVCCGD